MARMCFCLNQIAYIRNLNKSKSPDPVAAAVAAEMAGVDGITVQVKDDLLDITERDVIVLKQVVQSHFNVAVTLNDEMIKKTLKWLPDMVTLLPATGEQTPEQSLDLVTNLEYIEDVTAAYRANNVVVSALVKPDVQQIRAAARARMDYVQINTAALARIEDLGTMHDHVEQIKSVAMAANKLGLGVSVGRGLNEQNLRELGNVPYIEEFNVGRAIVSKSIMLGLEKTLRQFKLSVV